MIAGLLILAVGSLAIANMQINQALTAKTEAFHDLGVAKEETEAANESLGKAFTALTAEEGKTKLALDQERLAMYSYRIALAHREWETGRVSRARFLLEECPPHLRHWEWHFLQRLCHMAHRTLPRLPDPRDAVFTPDGKHLAVLDTSGVVFFRKVDGWWHAPDLGEAGVGGYTFALSPNGRLLAIGHQNRGITLWDIVTRQKVRTLSKLVERLAFSPDGQYLVGHGIKGLTIWEASSGREVRAESGHSINPVAFVDAKSLVRVGTSALVLEDVETRKVAKQWNFDLPIRETKVLDLKVSLDKARLITAHSNGMIRVWDGSSTTMIEELFSTAHATRVAIGPDGTRIASATLTEAFASGISLHLRRARHVTACPAWS